MMAYKIPLLLDFISMYSGEQQLKDVTVKLAGFFLILMYLAFFPLHFTPMLFSFIPTK